MKIIKSILIVVRALLIFLFICFGGFTIYTNHTFWWEKEEIYKREFAAPLSDISDLDGYLDKGFGFGFSEYISFAIAHTPVLRDEASYHQIDCSKMEPELSNINKYLSNHSPPTTNDKQRWKSQLQCKETEQSFKGAALLYDPQIGKVIWDYFAN